MSQPLAEYTFFPWVRLGAAGAINTVDPLGGAGPANPRAGVDYEVTINQVAQTKNVRLYGPGDIVGLDERMIARREPLPHAVNHLANELVFVDFSAEDFPWRYTPAKATAQEKLRPWLCLAVLEESEFERRSNPGAPLQSILVSTVAALPIPAQLWAWAHVQASEGIVATGAEASQAALNTLLEADPRLARSRILSPRRLRPRTKYHAFLIPTFETGRKAGLGLPIDFNADALAAAWSTNAASVELPIYSSWEFLTAEVDGDFEYFVSLLVPRAIDPRVGIRDMDVGAPGMGLPRAVPTGVPVLGLEGALKTPNTTSTIWSNPTAFINAIKPLLDLPADQEDSGSADPAVSLPFYGHFHAATRRSGPAGPWLQQINHDPRLRTAAGLGTWVVQANQDRFMSAAWEQVGEIMRANDLLRQARLSALSERRWYETELQNLDTDQFFWLVAPVVERIPYAGATVRTAWQNSRISIAVLDPAFRRALRSFGPIRRRAGVATNLLDIVTKINNGTLVPVPAKALPVRAVGFKTPLTDPRWAPTLGANAKVNELLDENAFRLDYINTIPPLTSITFNDIMSGVEPTGPADNPTAEGLRIAIIDLIQLIEATPPEDPIRPALNLPALRTTVTSALHPETTLISRMKARIRLLDRHGQPAMIDSLDRIMKAPDFPDPMYTFLRDLDSDLLIPNIHLIPENTISLLETNQKFIEAFMVGLNHEMSRELLWREYPTDMRGSYFRQFWDPADTAPLQPGETETQREERLRNITKIHTWPKTSQLGTHDPGNPSGQNRLVLLIRGDLLRRFPNVVITAVRAAWPAGPNPTRRELTAQEIFPIYGASAGVDINFIGFDLTVAQAVGSSNPAANDPGWFFVLRERPGEPRFGLDVALAPAAQPATNPDQLSWGHVLPPASFYTARQIDLSVPLTQVNQTGWPATWAQDSSHMAYLLYQVPAMLAVHASQMLAGLTP